MNVRCPKCAAPVEATGASATCPACGVSFAVGDAKTSADLAPPTDPMIGKVIGGCRLDERVGAGGMGIVYKAEQVSLGRTVAVKLLPEALRQDPQVQERFQREIAILARLAHPNIVGILDGGISEYGAFFVMEYVDGVSLRRILSTGGVKPLEALQIIPQLCDALEFAHARGVVHRDIKPENILLDKAGRVRLLDFGLSRIAKPDEPGLLTRPTQVLGTFEYMAPEQREASRAVDHRADLYSLGVVLYEMLTGELPIGRFDPPSQRNLQIDVRLDEVVLHALEKSPDRRYQRASDIKVEVERISSTPSQGPDAPPVMGAVRSQPSPAPISRPEMRTPPPAPEPSGIRHTVHPLLIAAPFVVVGCIGLFGGEWLAMLVTAVLLTYGLRQISPAVDKRNQLIVWCSLATMAIVACGAEAEIHDSGSRRWAWGGSFRNFGWVSPWIAAAVLMAVYASLPKKLGKLFESRNHVLLWAILGGIGIVGVGSGQFLTAIVAGGLALFVERLMREHGRAPDRPSPGEAHEPPPAGPGPQPEPAVPPMAPSAAPSAVPSASPPSAFSPPPPIAPPPPAAGFAPLPPASSFAPAPPAVRGEARVSRLALIAFGLALVGCGMVAAAVVAVVIGS